MIKKRKSWLKINVVFGLSIASLLFFFFIAFVRWKFWDDFDFKLSLDENKLFCFLTEKYLTWDARFLMPFSIVWFFLFKHLSFKTLMVLASLSFFLSNVILVKLIGLINKIKLTSKETFILAVMLNYFLWVSFKNHLSFSIYWLTGSYYIHNILIALIWIYFYVRYRFENKEKLPIIFYVFSIVIATSSQNITLGLFAIILIDSVLDYFETKRYRNALLLLIFVTGIILATVSIGSLAQFKRMHSTDYTVLEELRPIREYVFHVFSRYYHALEPNWHLIAVSALLIVFLFLKIKNYPVIRFEIKAAELSDKGMGQLVILFLKKYKWFIATLSCLVIYWPTFLYSPRYYVSFYYFLFIFFIFLFSPWLHFDRKKKERFFSNLALCVMGLLLIISSVDYYRTYQLSKLVKEFMAERETYLEENRGAKEIYLEALDFKTFNKPVRAIEVSNEQSYLNAVYANHFQIDSIFVSSCLTKKELRERNKIKKRE